MSWLVLGGSGFVGAAVVDALRTAGAVVSTAPAPRLTSSALTAPELRAEAAAHDRSRLAALIEGHDVVVNAAGLATPTAADGPELIGANALLPTVVALAAADAGASRMIHLSSAAVQGRTDVLDETADVQPFSPYSRSKALGEQALDLLVGELGPLSVVTVRATSVQGAGRPTTATLARLARSPLASVSAPGTQSSPITSVAALAELVIILGTLDGALPARVLQPWEGQTVRSVLEAAGGRPRVLPRILCRGAVRAGYTVSALTGGRLDGNVRRVELMWFGQRQVAGWAVERGLVLTRRVAEVLAAAARDR